VWRYVEEVDRETGEIDWDKPPVNARTGRLASSTNPKTWSPFDVALAAYRCDGLDGIGFCLHHEKEADEVTVAIDLDHCREPHTGIVEPWAQTIIDAIDSYTEVSPSGTGIRTILKGRPLQRGRKRGPVEVYCKGRYVTVTGNHVEGTPRIVESRPEALAAFLAEHFPDPKPSGQNGHAKGGWMPTGLDDAELIRRASEAKNGPKFQALWSGSWKGSYPSPSEADAALCELLAFWCGPDRDRIDSLFRQSGLYRAKWEREDYRRSTIDLALSGKAEFYEPARSAGLSRDAARRRHASTNGPPPTGGDEGGGRPEIVISTEEHDVNDRAIDALVSEVSLFQRNGRLVTVLRDQARQRQIERPAGTPRIEAVQPARLRELLARRANWKKQKKNRKQQMIEVPAHPPEWCVAAVMVRGSWPDVRPLEAVVESPVLREDGSVLCTPGYDPASALLYEPACVFPAVPVSPGLSEAKDAADLLLDLVSDFPFVSKDHQAAYLASLLTPFARFAVTGPCPLFAFDANCPGAGKSMLADLIATISTGRRMSRSPQSDSDEETKKMITSVLLAGDRLMLVDNVNHPLGGAALDAVLTARVWKDRVLGRSQTTGDLPALTVWYATGNNLTFKGDTVRRVVPCRLEAKQERPEERTGFRHPRLLEHAQSDRPRLVVAALTVLRAYFVAGKPKAGLTEFGSFESWSDTVREPVAWLLQVDPCATRTELREADPQTAQMTAVIEGLSELPGSGVGISTAEILRALQDPNNGAKFGRLRDALMEWSGNKDLPGTVIVGKKLRQLRGRVVGHKRLEVHKNRDNYCFWKVTEVET
jgi:hypothetical protein